MPRKITAKMTKAALAKTDWAAIDAQTDDDIERQIAADANVAPEITRHPGRSVAKSRGP